MTKRAKQKDKENMTSRLKTTKREGKLTMVDYTLLMQRQVYRSTSSGHRRNDDNNVQQTYYKVIRSTELSRCMLRTQDKQEHDDVHT
jgi:hypothetical protein